MIVVDVEASGIDPRKHSLLSIGAVDFENPDYQFYEECRVWEGAKIMKEALKVNGFTKEQATDPKKQSVEELIEKFLYWAKQCNTKILAGHNTHFDVAFLQTSCERAKLNWPFSFRIVDLHSVGYAHVLRRGKKIPMNRGKSCLNSEFMLKYVGLDAEPKPHHALTGAKMETEAFARLFYRKGLLKEYEQFLVPEYL